MKRFSLVWLIVTYIKREDLLGRGMDIRSLFEESSWLSKTCISFTYEKVSFDLRCVNTLHCFRCKSLKTHKSSVHPAMYGTTAATRLREFIRSYLCVLKYTRIKIYLFWTMLDTCKCFSKWRCYTAIDKMHETQVERGSNVAVLALLYQMERRDWIEAWKILGEDSRSLVW
jgi:hypothetical protein